MVATVKTGLILCELIYEGLKMIKDFVATIFLKSPCFCGSNPEADFHSPSLQVQFIQKEAGIEVLKEKKYAVFESSLLALFET